MDTWIKAIKFLFVMIFTLLATMSLMNGLWLTAFANGILCFANLYDVISNRQRIDTIILMFIGLIILMYVVVTG